jgi:hypothetical protein
VGPIAAVPNTNLNSVHCAGPNDCWAVGDEDGNEVILRWTGGPNWARVGPAAGLDNTDLNSVFCLATDDCWAVGDAFNPPGPVGNREVILHWNGTAWAQQADVVAIPGEDLSSVYCVTSNDCWAVGDAGGVAAQRPLILHWDGTAWATSNNNLNVNQDLVAVHVIGARQRPRMAWREDYQ